MNNQQETDDSVLNTAPIERTENKKPELPVIVQGEPIAVESKKNIIPLAVLLETEKPKMLWETASLLWGTWAPTISKDGSLALLLQGGYVSFVDPLTGRLFGSVALTGVYFTEVNIPICSNTGDLVVIKVSERVEAYSKMGQKLWHYQHPKWLTYPVMPAVSGNGTLVAIRHWKSLFLIDGATGQQIALVDLKEIATATECIPSISGDGTKVVLRDRKFIKAFSRNGELLWEFARTSWITRPYPPIISANGKVVVYRHYGETVILDGETGKVQGITNTAKDMRSEYGSTPSISDDGTLITVRSLKYVKVIEGISITSGDQENVKGESGTSTTGSIKYSFDSARCGRVIAQWKTPGIFTGGKPLITASGNVIAAKHGRSIYILRNVKGCLEQNISEDTKAALLKPSFSICTYDRKHIPGGPSVHNQYYHHTRMTQRLTTFSISGDGSLLATQTRNKIQLYSLRNFEMATENVVNVSNANFTVPSTSEAIPEAVPLYS